MRSVNGNIRLPPSSSHPLFAISRLYDVIVLQIDHIHISKAGEVRIRYACELLQESDMKIINLCYETGYNNVSNFNKHFKAIMKMAPQEYRLLHKLKE